MRDIEDRLERIEIKADKVIEKLSSVDVTLVAQHASLKEHIRRTELLEKKLEPVEKHVVMVQGALKLVGFLALTAGSIEAIVALLTYIRK